MFLPKGPASSHTFGVRAAGLFGCLLMVVGCAGSKSPPPVSDPQPAASRVPDQSGAQPEPLDGPGLESAPTRGPRPPGAIYRSEIERALARGPGYLLYELGPEPFRLSGKFVGWEITRVFPDEPELCVSGCDLRVGDIILSVNGDRLETPQAFSDMIDTLPKAQKLVVKSIRNDKRRVATYALVEG